MKPLQSIISFLYFPLLLLSVVLCAATITAGVWYHIGALANVSLTLIITLVLSGIAAKEYGPGGMYAIMAWSLALVVLFFTWGLVLAFTPEGTAAWQNFWGFFLGTQRK